MPVCPSRPTRLSGQGTRVDWAGVLPSSKTRLFNSSGSSSAADPLLHRPVLELVEAFGTRDILTNQPRLSVGFATVEHSLDC